MKTRRACAVLNETSIQVANEAIQSVLHGSKPVTNSMLSIAQLHTQWKFARLFEIRITTGIILTWGYF